VGHFQSPRALSRGQLLRSALDEHPWHPCCRRCLLKGCERWFLPRRPQARYCSPACQHAARRWRRWHASQRYRATTHGKQRRRDQARHYRSRRSARRTGPEPAPPPTGVAPQLKALQDQPPPPPIDPSSTTPPANVGQRPDEIPDQSANLPCDRLKALQDQPSPPPIDPSSATPPANVGQRPDEIPDQSGSLPCDRPGCYVLFVPMPRSPHQHFCSHGCRQALRRVRQREARLRHRRRCGSRPSRRQPRDPPSGDSAHVVTY
jgi:hypothetical protein